MLSLEAGDIFAQTSTVKVLGVYVDGGDANRADMDNRSNAAQAVWFGNHGWLRCSRVPLTSEVGRALSHCGSRLALRVRGLGPVY